MHGATHILRLLPLVVVGCTSLFLNPHDDAELTAANVVTTACPLGVPSTRVRIADTKDGIDLTFTTSMSNVDDVRIRARDQVSANGPNRHVGTGHEGRHGGNHGHGLQLWSMGELRTHVEDTPSGARISIVPVDPGRRDEVRKRVIDRVARLEANGCHD